MRHSSATVLPQHPPFAAMAEAVPFADFSRQYAGIREEVLAAVAEACDRQHYILGEQVTRFETLAAEKCAVRHAVGCSSGTDALWLGLAAAGIGPGDSVITTPFSFFATVSSILRAGAQPLLADIQPDTFNLDPTSVERILKSPVGNKVRAILPVHLFGQPAEMDAFRRLGERYNAFVLEDAAQAWGAGWHGQPAGSLGNAAAFSFYPTKNLSAFGDAGLLTTNDDKVAERARMLRAHGMRQRYYHEEVGWNTRLDTVQAAVLLVKLRYIDGWNRQRRQRAETYDDLFRETKLGAKVVLPTVRAQANHVFHQYVVRIPGIKGKRDKLRTYLTGKNIGSEVYYPVPLHLQPALQSLGYSAGDFPESERAAGEVLALPIFPELREDEQRAVVSAIKKGLGQ